ncbi:lysylphosphatidylglycerol synthase domain-containing protein [Candidatus Solirubrobacter pratensis]|uniref:lysylphosphatidylglycerol synthase domain-containing protein n=1 Tax=Candidatus Solirubrobacter pratensis TaxID=1298857 RepID=UPI0003FF4C68|nr:lysylphosphatidylglycerol synthase domain-containing protein [Candidatus Solirubrobacter pratensis]
MSPPGETDADRGLDFGAAARRGAFFGVVAVAAAVLVATLPGVDDVRDRLAAAEPHWIAAAAVCAVGSMLGFVRALWAVFDRVVPWRRALVLGLAEQGANVLLPAGGAGGPALGAYVMRRLGVPGRLATERHAALFLATSAVSFFALALAGTLTSVGVLPSDVSLPWRLVPAAVAAAIIALAVVYARLPAPAKPARGRIRTAAWRVRRFVHGGMHTTYHLLRHGDRFLAAGAIMYFACDVGSLGCAFEAFGGGGPPVGDFVLAYALGHAGALLPTPGGVGGTEGGLIGMFVVYGSPLSLAAAAVLGYRVFQLALPAILGAGCLLRVRHVLAHPPPRELVAARFEGLDP